MGSAAQGISCPDPLVARGVQVIRFDHRDTGRSSVVDFDTHRYAIADLAADCLAVLDCYGLPAAHVGPVPHLQRTGPPVRRADRPRDARAGLVALSSITAPTTIVHGDQDPIFPLAHGEALAAAIPGARLHVVPGMGHAFFSPGLPEEVADLIRL